MWCNSGVVMWRCSVVVVSWRRRHCHRALWWLGVRNANKHLRRRRDRAPKYETTLFIIVDMQPRPRRVDTIPLSVAACGARSRLSRRGSPRRDPKGGSYLELGSESRALTLGRARGRAAVSAVAIAVAAVSSTRLCRHPRSRRAARRRASRAPTPEVSAKRREFVGRRDLRRRARDRTSHARATARRASLRATCELAAITAIAARGLGRGHALCRTQEEVTVIFMQARDPRAAAAPR